jgi:TRAP transporter TAXI family solute receptor
MAGCGKKDDEKPLTAAQRMADAVEKGEVPRVFIGTGSKGGLYLPTGKLLANLLNEKTDEYGFKVVTRASAGSVENINGVLAGDFDFGFAQSDRQYEAANGIADWREVGPQHDLRALFAIYPEAVTIVADAEAGIQSVTDLKGKRVSIGLPDSGQYRNAMDILEHVGLNPREDIVAEMLSPDVAAEKLSKGRLDAFFYTVGHPCDIIRSLSQQKKIRLVSAGDPASLVSSRKYYVRTIIPLAQYPELVNDRDIPTIGVQATLVASASLPDEVAYAMAREFIDNLEQIRDTDPAYAALTYASALRSLSAPLHPGAIRYYAEVAPRVMEKSRRSAIP